MRSQPVDIRRLLRWSRLHVVPVSGGTLTLLLFWICACIKEVVMSKMKQSLCLDGLCRIIWSREMKLSRVSQKNTRRFSVATCRKQNREITLLPLHYSTHRLPSVARWKASHKPEFTTKKKFKMHENIQKRREAQKNTQNYGRCLRRVVQKKGAKRKDVVKHGVVE